MFSCARGALKFGGLESCYQRVTREPYQTVDLYSLHLSTPWRGSHCACALWRHLIFDAQSMSFVRRPGHHHLSMHVYNLNLTPLGCCSLYRLYSFLSRISQHIEQCSGFNKFQSAYRRGHSTETALLRLLNDVRFAADKKSRPLLALLDLSAAFD